MRFTVYLLLILFSLFAHTTKAQNFTYAEVTDIHVGAESGLEAAIATVNDINKNPNIKFVVVTGDLTANGSYEQLDKAKSILDKLNKKYYVIPGNHEDVWSASGGTYFAKLFGADRFKFETDEYVFIGTDCGPMLRHGHAHVPQDALNWLDSTLTSLKDKTKPVIFLNHYPMVDQLDNTAEVIKILKKYNTQLILCGHGHSNRKMNFFGIPGIMCRTNLVVKGKSGYNLVDVKDHTFNFSVRYAAGDSVSAPWAKVALKEIPKDHIKPVEPDYSVNTQYANVTQQWQYENPLGICGGFTIVNGVIYTGTYDGKILAIDKATGKKMWSYIADGRIFSTPTVAGDKLVFTSSEGYVQCITTTGKPVWKFKSARAVVSSPLIKTDRVFVGFSDGSFRCLNLKTGAVIWDFNQITPGFVQSPMLYNNKVYFGAWNAHLYALDQATGKLVWSWTNKLNPGYSPAFLAPSAAHNRIFAVTPDHYVACIDASSGKVIWHETNNDIPVWFSKGLSADSSLLFVKTRNSKAYGLSATAPKMQPNWQAAIDFNDDAAITPIEDDGKTVYFSSSDGIIQAISKQSGKTVWKHKLSNSTITMIYVDKDEIWASTIDGKIACLKIK